MDAIRLQTVAFLLLTLAMPLISYGSMAGNETLAVVGLVAIAVGAAIPVGLRLRRTDVTPA
ncbi:hypothetical protein JCM17823_27470 [Halorubrum gandharaense]